MPKLLLKTTNQNSFTLEVDTSATVDDIKKIMESKEGKDAFPVDRQRMIYEGRELEDNTLIRDLNVLPPKYITLMVTGSQNTGPRVTSNSSAGSSTSTNYLFNGIPEDLRIPEALIDIQRQQQRFVELLHSSRYQQIEELIDTDPDPRTLPQILDRIATSNPELVGTIINYQAEFLQLLNSNWRWRMRDGARANRYTTNSEDREAINRLSSMGFPEWLATEAYFACSGNENMAARYLMARMPLVAQFRLGGHHQEQRTQGSDDEDEDESGGRPADGGGEEQQTTERGGGGRCAQ